MVFMIVMVFHDRDGVHDHDGVHGRIDDRDRDQVIPVSFSPWWEWTSKSVPQIALGHDERGGGNASLPVSRFCVKKLDIC